MRSQMPGAQLRAWHGEDCTMPSLQNPQWLPRSFSLTLFPPRTSSVAHSWHASHYNGISMPWLPVSHHEHRALPLYTNLSKCHLP